MMGSGMKVMTTTRAMTAGMAVVMTMLVGAAPRGQSSPSDARGQKAAAAPAVATAESSAEIGAVVGKYCVTCHNQRLKTGGLTLDTEGLTNVGQHAEVWE